jgi:hypothetical protein
MSTKVSLKDRILYLIIMVFLILDLTKSNAIWASKTGYYIQIVTRIIACIVFAIIIILDSIDLSRKLKNKKNIYSKKQISKMISTVSIEIIALILFILATYKNVSSLQYLLY